MNNIKVDRIQLIEALEAARQVALLQSKDLTEKWAAYDKLKEAWCEKVRKTGTVQEFDSYANYVRVTPPANLPQPTPPEGRRPTDRYWISGRAAEMSSLDTQTKQKLTEIDTTIKLLKMSNEVAVSATAYKTVSQYL